MNDADLHEYGWELLEMKDFGIYRYYILQNIKGGRFHPNLWRGVVVNQSGQTHIVDSDNSLDACRLSLINLGQR